MQIIPLQPIASQLVTATLGNQICTIRVYQKFFGLYLDLAINNAPIVTGVVCQNLNRIVRSAYLGFAGDLCFLDSQGESDPDYTGLGSRFSLAYLEQDELASLLAVPA